MTMRTNVSMFLGPLLDSVRNLLCNLYRYRWQARRGWESS